MVGRMCGGGGGGCGEESLLFGGGREESAKGEGGDLVCALCSGWSK